MENYDPSSVKFDRIHVSGNMKKKSKASNYWRPSSKNTFCTSWGMFQFPKDCNSAHIYSGTHLKITTP